MKNDKYKTQTHELQDKLEIEGVNANGYGIMPKIVMQDNRLTIEAKAIYAYIVSYAGAGNSAFPSLKKILADLNISKNRFYKHRNLLIQCNYITVTAIRNEKNEIIKNLYTLIANPMIEKEGGMVQNEPYPIPQNEPYPMVQNREHIINNLKINRIIDTEKEDTKKIDTEKSSSESNNPVSTVQRNETDIEQLREQELLKHFAESNQERSFLNTENLKLIALFSDSLVDAENMQGIILRAKKAVEKAQGAVLVVDDEYLHNQVLDIQSEIANTLRRVYHKRKTDHKIKNLDNYIYGAFKNLFETLLCQWQEFSRDEIEGVGTITTYDWVEQ